MKLGTGLAALAGVNFAVAILLWMVAAFIALSIIALAFRFTFTWGIDTWSWCRQALNNLASIYPGTH